MLIADRLVYLQLQKTGSTFAGKLLAVGLDAHQVGKHDPPRTSDREDFAGRLIVGSIRHPLDWYVSLWGYTCSGRGELYDRTAGSAWRHGVSVIVKAHEAEFSGLVRELTKDRERWELLYKDVNDVEAFREWIQLLHENEGRQAWECGLLGTAVEPNEGLYSHWYRRCFSWRAHPLTRLARRPRNHGELAVEAHIRLENIEDDLDRVMSQAGYSEQERSNVLDARPAADRNASIRSSTELYWNDTLVSRFLELDHCVFAAGNYEV